MICCYNTGPRIVELLDRIEAVLSARGGQYEVVLVNDASPDPETWPAIEKSALERSTVRAIDLMANVGQFRALICGLESARGEIIITLDDDLQHPPEEIPKLLDALAADHDLDVVIGTYGSKRHSRFRNAGTRLVDAIYRRAYGKQSELRLTSFRAMRRPVATAMTAHGTVRPIPGALLLQTTSRIENVPVEHHDRADGRSGWRIRRLAAATLDTIVAGSVLPLRAISGFGLMIAGVASLLGLGYLLAYLLGVVRAQGFTTLVLLLILFGGMTLASIGIVGEYLARVVAEVTGEPRYRIRRQVD